MELNSPFASENLRKNPKRFMILLGVTPEQFDLIFKKLIDYELKTQSRMLALWSAERIKRLINKNESLLREYLTITLLYIRQYNIQEVIATSFGITQPHISRIISKIVKILENILPIPELALESLIKRIKRIPASIRKSYSATLIIDATDQRIERPKDQQKQMENYSGKKKSHNKKFQICQTQNGFIVDITKAISGSVHDFRIFKERRLNPKLYQLTKLMKKVILWTDSAYLSIENLLPNWICLVNERAKRNHPLTDDQKLKNKLKNKIRVLIEHTIGRIKKYRCCSDRTRNMSDKKQSIFWNIVAGICNLRRAFAFNIQYVFGYP